MTDNTAQEVQEDVKNPAALIAKNKELLAKLKAAQEDLATAQTNLEAAKADSANWRKQWHDVAVIEPLDASLEAASAGPVKYLRAELLARGILKMQPDEQGIERPAWYQNGELVTPGNAYDFLVSLNDPTLSRMIRSSGMSGTGATGSQSSFTAHTPQTEDSKTPPPVFGLR